MDLQAEKIELVKLLLETEKVSLIKKIKLLFKNEADNDSDNFELSDTQKEELDRRLESYKNNPESLLNWEDIKHNW